MISLIRVYGFRIFKSGQRSLALALLVVATAVLPLKAHAQEQLGEIKFSDIFIEPNFTLTEPHQGRFNLGSSYLEGAWDLPLGEVGASDFVFDVRAVMKAGAASLLGRPARYEAVDGGDRLALVEAYGEASTTYGRVRLGLIPIPYGLEGGDVEARLVFPRSLFYSQGWVGFRDQGFSFRISNNGFFSDWAVHNGESGPDLDNETWFSARWGWNAVRGLTLGLSGTTGRTSPRSTNASGSADSVRAGLDVDRESKIRLATAFGEWESRELGIRAEAHIGEVRQGDDVVKVNGGHFDVDYEIWRRLVVLARYDSLDPNTMVSGDRIDEPSIGLAWRSRDENSVLTVLGSKIIREGSSQDAHQLQVIWRMTPSAMARLAPL